MSEETQKPCVWTEDPNWGTWETACGRIFVLNDGTPTENHLHFCCYCGKPLEEKRA